MPTQDTETGISIHALREEGDEAVRKRQRQVQDFYPRPPRGGRLSFPKFDVFASNISIHALREEGDYKIAAEAISEEISIHALREEGDAIQRGHGGLLRISIHALREEGDHRADSIKKLNDISIHALREEGDLLSMGIVPGMCLFLSTPSARRATSERRNQWKPQKFLSTPSARRATAKTETKSLFSYKLYNILHGFRRALIYNGSKNYPNHAK